MPALVTDSLFAKSRGELGGAALKIRATFEKLVLVRTIATKSFEFEEIKKIEEAKVQVKLKEIEKS